MSIDETGVTRKNVRVCQVLYNSTYYDVLIAVDDLDEVNNILQEWALANSAIGVALDLPEALIYNKDITEVITTLSIDNFAYIESAISSYMDVPRYAGISGTLPTFPTALATGVYVAPAATAFLYSEALMGGYFGNYTIATKDLTLTEGMNYIGIRFNAGAPEWIKYDDEDTFDYSSIIPVLKILDLSDTLYVLPYGQAGYGLPEKTFEIMKKRLVADIISTFTLDNSTLYIELSALTVSHGTAEVACTAVDTEEASNDMFLYSKSVAGAWESSSVTQINNTQYQSASGLASLAGGEYVINYVYRLIDDSNKMLLNTLSNKFASEALALASEMVTDLPDVIKDHCVLVGRFIVAKDSTSPMTQKVQRVSFGTVV